MTIPCLLLCLLVSCSPKVVTKVEYRDRIEYKDRVDSVVVLDSIYVTERIKGDTVYVSHDRWRTEYRDRMLTDTVIRTDSIPYPVEVIRYVEKPLKRWQSGMIAVGFLAITLLVAAIALRLRNIK